MRIFNNIVTLLSQKFNNRVLGISHNAIIVIRFKMCRLKFVRCFSKLFSRCRYQQNFNENIIDVTLNLHEWLKRSESILLHHQQFSSHLLLLYLHCSFPPRIYSHIFNSHLSSFILLTRPWYRVISFYVSCPLWFLSPLSVRWFTII